ncbi:PLP-dependent aminotransferase family protein [Polluticoccus soli]|uniref:MocR-like pyridoxine biosynthesis transcription factor PdxR n=1 Tax=Polluticoccus soli TaxID=3034150 RepID=UPI0023E1093F|nr:PLP-dependent aminotransferase family protein [Flavipsychrobacter sp. JY13-12]
MNYAYLSHIKLRNATEQPVYMQLRDAFRELIANGTLQSDNKMPSSRMLSEHFAIHRQTVVAAMEELVAEGWLVSKQRKGLFVNDKLPEIKPRTYGSAVKTYPATASFNFHQTTHPTVARKSYLFGFDDGYPDIRIAPYSALSKAYSQTLAENAHRNIMTRVATGAGSLLLREELAKMMRTYRGLLITADNVLLTHGSQMSIYLVANRLLTKGDNVVVTKPNYLTSNNLFKTQGANLLEIGVDDDGMRVDELEAVCKKKKVRFVFVTSHHHHPTTVTLSIERRIRLLQLAEQHGFAIIEDDYDYDYHYENKPLLPIASYDRHGSVIYIGSFSKILSQAFRVGYIIAPADFIQQVSVYRRLVDRQGDQVLEDAFGKLFQNNTIKNHIRKAAHLYKERRDATYELLNSELNNYMYCNLPEGGLAFWTHVDRSLSLEDIAVRCAAKGVFFPDGRTYNYDKAKMNACRIGFASMNTKELHKAVDILKTELKRMPIKR